MAFLHSESQARGLRIQFKPCGGGPPVHDHRCEASASYSSLVAERLALHDFVDEGAETVILCSQAADDVLDFESVWPARGGAGGVSQELGREVARKLVRVGKEEMFEAFNVLERLSLDGFTAGVHRRPFPIQADAIQNPVVVAPGADDVVALQ